MKIERKRAKADGLMREHEIAFVEWCHRWLPSDPWPVQKDEAESRRTGKAVRAVMKQCWFNARKVIMKLPDYGEASYVEGWAVLQGGMPIEHGWLVQNDTIIDPTLPDDLGVYFPGLEFKGRKGIEEFLATPKGRKCKNKPYLFAFGWGGMDHIGMQRSWAFVRRILDVTAPKRIWSESPEPGSA